MSCPVQVAIADLYKTGRYEGGSVVEEESVNSIPVQPQVMLFYITRRRLEFARGLLKPTNTVLDDAIESSNPYHERMFADYTGVTSQELFRRLFDPICAATCAQFLQTADMIMIAEAVCSGELARDFPDGMSLPEIVFDPNALCGSEENPMKIIEEVNKMINYANKLRVCGMETHIDPVQTIQTQLREFTLTGTPEELLAQDLEVAEYTYQIEQVHCYANAAMIKIVEFLQKIVAAGK